MLRIKRMYLIFALSVLGLAIMLLSGVFLYRRTLAQNPTPETNILQSVPQQDSALFLVREYQGRLAVYREDSSSPFQVYDVYVSTLPEYDRQLLKEGIPAHNQAQLDRLIEDYTS